MSITFDADDPRTIKALELAAEADLWLTGRTRDGGQVFGVPSQSDPQRYYIVAGSSCDCPDFARSAESPQPRACKHMLAVRLHCELVRAQEHRALGTPVRRRGRLQLVRGTSARD